MAPHGIERWDEAIPSGQMVLSVCEPRETFSAGRAMERNALIYAAGRASVVGHVRFREGGSWHGAADALRRRLTEVLVYGEEGDRAVRALVALGARRLDHPKELEDALANPRTDERLFAALRAG